MRRTLVVGVVAAAMALTAGVAQARTITVGQCQYGVWSETTHEDPVTGTTTVVVCDPVGPIGN